MNQNYPDFTADTELDRVRGWTSDFAEENQRPPTYFIQTFGCQQNDHDSEIAAGILEEMGFAEGTSVDDSELVLFNTCSVRANADERFFGHVGRLKPIKKKTLPVIGVLGCMMEQDLHRDVLFKTFSYVDFALGAGAMELLPAALGDVLYSERKQGTRDLTRKESDPFATGQPVRRVKPHRALITVMTGCNNICSYCIVPYTRGREKSRPYEQIMEEAIGTVRSGAVEIMLLGQNVNSYGNDVRLQGGQAPGFAELIRDISLIESLGIVRFMTSHPKDLSDELIEVIGSYPVIEPHVHLPIQSGSDRILKKMNRKYTAAHFLDRVHRLRDSRPGLTITTDLIVGFPGEDEEDFEATLRVMEEARFDAAFTFLYSPRSGTPAASLYDQGDRDLVQGRFERLVELQNQISLESNRSLLGKTVEVLLDGPSRRDPRILSGRTRDDRLVNVSFDDSTSLQADGTDHVNPYVGSFVRVKIVKAGSFSLEGHADIP
ncbi:MAG: tRNA (N6-isopentenyl adenosine(37)-C2)-methylthiotransferase MiaB [Clostridiaceae bacterium]|nr:tRNA (N6-isopentenyl adenosine(37)-C2)-methylthiotransferase MiaB [Clostridiaceae bacterium]